MNRFKDKSAGKIFNIMDFAVVFLLLFEGVSLVDTQTVLCPEDLVVAAQPGKAYADVEWREPSISAPQILTYKSHCPGRLPLGTMDVSYEYSEYFASLMDVSVIGSCSFTVNVMAADSEPPVVRDCPSSPQSRTFEAGIGNLVVTWTEPSATDNSGQVELVESTARSGKEFYLGGSKRFPVTYTFQDPTGNRAYCYFEIEFKAVDTTPPNIMRCPDPLVQEVPLDVTGAFVPWSFPSVTDNSGQFTLTTDPVVPDNFFSLGTHQITFNFTDPSGNYAICVTSVQVVARDLTPPEIIHCPSSIVIGVPPGVGTAEVDWLQPEATDDSGTVLLEFQSSPPGIYDVDTTLEVIYVFRDLAANEAVCRFSVRVIEDEVPPTIFGCPTEGIERFINSGQIEKEVFWEEPFGLDETSAEIVYQSHHPGDVFIQGNTTVEYIFEDSTDNSASCTFNVIVTVTENAPQRGSGLLHGRCTFDVRCVRTALSGILVVVSALVLIRQHIMETAPNTVVVVIIICVLALLVSIILVTGATVCLFQRVNKTVKSGSLPTAPKPESLNEGFYSELGERERQMSPNSAMQSQGTTTVEYIEMEPAEEHNSYVKPS